MNENKYIPANPKHPFKVPDNYFDELATIIQHSVSKPSKTSLFQLKTAYTTLGITTLALLFTFLFFKNETKNSDQLLSDIDHIVLIAYAEEVDLEELYLDELTNQTFYPETTLFSEETTDKQTLKNYTESELTDEFDDYEY